MCHHLQQTGADRQKRQASGPCAAVPHHGPRWVPACISGCEQLQGTPHTSASQCWDRGAERVSSSNNLSGYNRIRCLHSLALPAIAIPTCARSLWQRTRKPTRGELHITTFDRLVELSSWQCPHDSVPSAHRPVTQQTSAHTQPELEQAGNPGTAVLYHFCAVLQQSQTEYTHRKSQHATRQRDRPCSMASLTARSQCPQRNRKSAPNNQQKDITHAKRTRQNRTCSMAPLRVRSRNSLNMLWYPVRLWNRTQMP